MIIKFANKGRKSSKQFLLDELAKKDVQVLMLAYVYARNAQTYGVDVTKAICSATENVSMMDRAYQKGYRDALQRQKESEAEIKLGDEVVGDFGAKGVVVGMVTYDGEALLSLLMKDYEVPQLVKASRYKTKTGRHFPQIVEALEQIKGEVDGK